MSYSFEKLYTIHLLCFKCDKPLEVSYPKDSSEVLVGGRLYECKECEYRIIVCGG